MRGINRLSYFHDKSMRLIESKAVLFLRIFNFFFQRTNVKRQLENMENQSSNKSIARMKVEEKARTPSCVLFLTFFKPWSARIVVRSSCWLTQRSRSFGFLLHLLRYPLFFCLRMSRVSSFFRNNGHVATATARWTGNAKVHPLSFLPLYFGPLVLPHYPPSHHPPRLYVLLLHRPRYTQVARKLRDKRERTRERESKKERSRKGGRRREASRWRLVRHL